MHSKNVSETINVRNAVRREAGVFNWNTEEDYSRRYWRKVNKRNGGRKTKTLRSHRTGR